MNKQTIKILDAIVNASYLTSTPEELAEYFKGKLCVDENYVSDWYISSCNKKDKPAWTENHITELCNDFYLIPKR